MSELLVGKFFLFLSFVFAFTFLLGGLLERVKIPTILGAIFSAMILRYTPLYPLIKKYMLIDTFNMLAEFGVLFLLFFIGLQIDIDEMKSQSKDIITATFLNTIVPFMIGFCVMLFLGYGYKISFVIGLITMPTAEAVIVPILDEFNLSKSKIGNFIIGAGVLDDVIEVFLLAFVSILVSEKSGLYNNSSEIREIILNITLFIVLSFVARRYILLPLSKWLKVSLKNIIFISVMVLFLYGGLAEYSGLGLVVGAITAGILMQPIYKNAKEIGKKSIYTVSAFSYGFFGMIFFLWIGFSINIEGIFKNPELTLILFFIAFFGKLLGIFMMVPMKKLSNKEAWIIGIGLNARLTTEIIVSKILFDAHIIEINLFTAIVAAASLSTIIVPILLSILIKKWKKDFLSSGDKNGV